MSNMRPRGIRFDSILFPAAVAVAALIAFWTATEFRSRALGWASAALGVAAAGAVVYALRARQSEPGLALSRAAWGRLILFGAVTASLAAIAFGVWLAHGRANGIVHPGRVPVTRLPESVGITDYQSVSFLSSDGLTLRGWYAPTRNGAAVITLHGHAANREGLLDDAALLAARGYGVLLFDMRNNGESDGSVTTLGLLEVNDVRGAVAFVAAQTGVDANRIGLIGHSMGGATAIMSAARIPQVRAVVAESAYTSLEDNIVNGVREVAHLPPFPFAPLVIFFGQQEAGLDITAVRPVDDIASISPRPILIVHGELDETIPVSNAYELYAAASEPKELYVIPNVGHTGLAQAGAEEYVRRVAGFFDEYLLAP
ncbi:MAG: alpha/beta fold hydrolase [Chloroflexota bacterium]